MSIRIHRVFPVIIYIFLFCGQSSYGRDLYRAVLDFRDCMYKQNFSDEQLYDIYNGLKREIISAGLPRYEELILKANLEYFMGRAYQSFDDVDTVAAHFMDIQAGRFLHIRKYYTHLEETLVHYDEAVQTLEICLNLREGSEPCRLYAELLGQMILLKDLGFLMKYGPKSRSYISAALKKNPYNVKAKILEAGEDIYTPLLFGGNPDLGITKMLEIESSQPLDREDKFNIYSGVAFGFASMEQWDRAYAWFQKALTVYPGNVFAEGMSKLMMDYVQRM